MKNVMKAVICKSPAEMVLEEVPVPEVGPDEILVKVKVTAICGSD
jgi:L-iditol 2-dehydrogenase